jgi:type III restriction enzyme
LVFSNGIRILGTLRNCLDYALNDDTKLTSVFVALKVKFKVAGGRNLLDTAIRVNDFRHNRVAHQEQPLTDAKLAQRELIVWTEAIRQFSPA